MKVLIVGGVAGGASAAARLRRLNEDAQIIIFEQSPYISYANCGLLLRQLRPALLHRRHHHKAKQAFSPNCRELSGAL